MDLLKSAVKKNELIIKKSKKINMLTQIQFIF